ncbi:hypothetical protein [Alteribacillus sp. HJP-4]|uniref:hypothetical protein n=1 Tax=Alteribacillus sp. HJP-4 TaxID=2775394 RepID=UPI0035CD219D
MNKKQIITFGSIGFICVMLWNSFSNDKLDAEYYGKVINIIEEINHEFSIMSENIPLTMVEQNYDQDWQNEIKKSLPRIEISMNHFDNAAFLFDEAENRAGEVMEALQE